VGNPRSRWQASPAPAASASTASQGPNANVAFAVGPDYYLVGFQAHANGGPTRAQLIAAAQSLYHRVHG